MPSMESIRVDISKEFLAGNTEAAHRCFIAISDSPTSPETGSVVPQTAMFKEGTTKRRTDQLWEKYWRFDIKFPASGSKEIMHKYEKNFSLSAETPDLMVFPVSKSLTNGSYLISLKKGNPKQRAPQKPPLELVQPLMENGSFDDIVQFAMVRTNFALIVQVDMNKLPFEKYLDKVQWLNDETKEAGMLLCEPDRSIARGRDFYQNNSKPQQLQAPYKLSSFASCPRTNTFLDVALAAALFGTVSRIRPTNSEGSDAHASHTYQVKFMHLVSAFAAEEENVTEVYFTPETSKNIQKKAIHS